MKPNTLNFGPMPKDTPLTPEKIALLAHHAARLNLRATMIVLHGFEVLITAKFDPSLEAGIQKQLGTARFCREIGLNYNPALPRRDDLINTRQHDTSRP